MSWTPEAVKQSSEGEDSRAVVGTRGLSRAHSRRPRWSGHRPPLQPQSGCSPCLLRPHGIPLVPCASWPCPRSTWLLPANSSGLTWKHHFLRGAFPVFSIKVSPPNPASPTLDPCTCYSAENGKYPLPWILVHTIYLVHVQCLGPHRP